MSMIVAFAAVRDLYPWRVECLAIHGQRSRITARPLAGPFPGRRGSEHEPSYRRVARGRMVEPNLTRYYLCKYILLPVAGTFFLFNLPL